MSTFNIPVSDPAVWWHYMWELAFYWSLFISQFFDAKRKVALLTTVIHITQLIQDFWEMFIHHVATLALLILSWTNHMHRMGSLVLLIHDFADLWLELAKLARYAKFQV
jgi:ceramide synthetase